MTSSLVHMIFFNNKYLLLEILMKLARKNIFIHQRKRTTFTEYKEIIALVLEYCNISKFLRFWVFYTRSFKMTLYSCDINYIRFSSWVNRGKTEVIWKWRNYSVPFEEEYNNSYARRFSLCYHILRIKQFSINISNNLFSVQNSQF